MRSWDPRYLDYLREARRKLEDFTDWLVRGYGVTLQQAERQTAIVCRAIWETDGHPVEALSEDMKRTSWSQAKSAIKRYYTWQITRPGTSDQERRYARQQIEELLRVMPPGTAVRRPVKRVSPLPEQEFMMLLEGISEWAYKHRDRVPWAWEVLSICLKVGLPHKMMVHISRSDLRKAVKDGPEWGSIQCWSRAGKRPSSRIIPISLILTEAKGLIKWKWGWRLLADIISPSAAKERRPAVAAGRCSRLQSEYIKSVLGRSPHPQEIRAASHVWLLRQLDGDWLSVSRITGIRESTLRRSPELLAVYR